MLMLSLISCVKHGSSAGNLYYIVGVEERVRILEVKSRIVLKQGEVADLIINNGTVESAAIIEDNEAAQRIKKLYAAVNSDARSFLNKGAHYKKGIVKLDELTKAMWPKLNDCPILFSCRS